MPPTPDPRSLPRLALALAAVAGCSTTTAQSPDGGAPAPADVAADVADGAPGDTHDASADGAPNDVRDAPADVAADEGAGPMTAAARCAAMRASIAAAGFDDRVTVRCDDRFAYVVSDTYPAHEKMNGITGTNDQVPVPAPGYASPVTLAPARGTAPLSIDAALGVAVNGVPIYDYSSQGALDLARYDPRYDTVRTGELDRCGGHAGRGDDYHYHAAPSCMIAAMRNRGPGAILGWAFDGYPIYGDANPDGSAIAAGTLDVCNGQPDATFGFRYHTSPTPPYIVQCLTGAFDVANAPRVMPLSRAGGGGGRPPGEKAPGGVTGLRYVESPDGVRTMTYEHMGRSYSITYRPSSAANCWDFEDASYTTRGVLQRGSYCRSVR